MNFVTPKIKNILIRSVSVGFISGFSVGCFPNKLCIEFEDKKYNSLPIPLISGLICSVGLMVSPLLIINYSCNGMFFNLAYLKKSLNHHYYLKNGNH